MTHDKRYNDLMKKINRMSVREALESGIAVQCPICGIIHPGIRYIHPNHRIFCGPDCYEKRMSEE
jgi:uncharacterized protein (DUF983 family)